MDQFLVFFDGSRADDDAIVSALLNSPFVRAVKDGRIDGDEGLTFGLAIHRGQGVRSKVDETGLDEVVAECDACVVVTVPDLDAALDDINTLIEMQGNLQDVTGGVLFLSWTGEAHAAG